MLNLYAILGIAPDADEEAIRTAYRTLARRYHPDVGAGSSSDKFRQITEAYETLSDPSRRGVYDTEYRRIQPPRRMVPDPIIVPEPMITAEPFTDPRRWHRAEPPRRSHLDELFQALLDSLQPRRW